MRSHRFGALCARPRRVRLFLAICLFTFSIVMVWGGLLPGTTIVYAQAGNITGTVFQDFNADGFRSSGGAARTTAIDAPVEGVSVTAFDTNGQMVGSAVTAADGTYNLAVTGNGPYRVEFGNFPAGLSAGITTVASQSGATNPPWSEITSASTVQFIKDGGDSNVSLALVRAEDFCQVSPTLVTSRHVVDSAVFGTNSGSETALTDFPYSASGTTPTEHSLAIAHSAIGSTWGLGYSRTTDQLYTAAFMKRFSSYGPGGTGAIYQITREPAPGQAMTYADLNALFGPNTAGPNLHNLSAFRDYKTDAASGLNTFDAVGKTALGGLDLSDDDLKLYVMNLYDRQLYEIPLDAPPTVANIRHTPVPLNQNTLSQNGCSNPDTDIRPFAVEYYQGQLYVGIVCSGQSSPASPEFATWTDTNNDSLYTLGEPYTDLNNNQKMDFKVDSQLHAYVYTVDPATLQFNPTPVLAFPLNYPALSAHSGVRANWNPWSTTFIAYEGSRFAYPQPMLTGITFDQGNMILGVRDRYGEQVGYTGLVLNPNNESRTNIAGGATGDLLRACGNPTAGWTVENNGQCGGFSTGGAGTKAGPSGGEYYFQDNWLGHSETVQGGIFHVPGFPEVAATIWDPIDVHTQGARWFDNATGTAVASYGLVPNSKLPTVSWGKGNGLGDLVALCEPAPIEVGNRVWLDANGNGMQEPGEKPIEGVTVRLYRPGVGPDQTPGTGDDNRALATAVTDAQGEYYFYSDADGDTLIDEIGVLTSTLQPNSSYEIRLDKSDDYLPDEPLYGLSLTEQNDSVPSPFGSDSNDSDGVNVNNPSGSAPGNYPVIVFTTGGPGASNHTLDFGFTSAGVSLGNQVWFDVDNDGALDPQEKGAAGVTVELFRDSNDNGVLEAGEQTPLATQTTNSNGFYLFTQSGAGQALAPGGYLVGVAPVNFSAAGILVGQHSSGTSAGNNGSLTESAAAVANNDVDNEDNGQKQSNAFYSGGVLSSVINLSNNEPESEIPANQPGGSTGGTPGIADPNRNNASNVTVDFGFYQVALGDRVFVDVANNCLRDGTDGAFNNVPVQLFAADGVTEIPAGPDGMLGTADDALGGLVTANYGNGDGQYLFRGLAQGEYSIHITPPPGYTSSSGSAISQSSGLCEPGVEPDTESNGKITNDDDNGINGGVVINSALVSTRADDPRLPNPADVTYATGTTFNRTVDFGLLEVVDPVKYSLGNRVWLDTGAGSASNNGNIDPDERGLPNVPITLYLSSGAGLTALKTTTSDAAGYYRFDNLDAGDYIVEVTKPAGVSPGTGGVEGDPNLDGDSNQNGSNDTGSALRSGIVTLGPADNEPGNEADLSSGGQGATDPRANMTVDLGFILNSPLSLGNQIFADHNNNGYFDSASEIGLTGAQVNLYYDYNNDGAVDDLEAAQPYLMTTTSELGGVGGYYLFSGLLPGNYVVELPSSNFAAGAPLEDYLSCSGQNGAITGPVEPAGDPDDPTQDDDTLDVGTRFFNIGTGSVSIRTQPITLQPNTETLVLGAPDGNNINEDSILDPEEDPRYDNDPTTPDGNENLIVDLCLFKPYSLGNRVWFDSNDNGAIDADESGISGVTVSLYDAQQSLVVTSTTNAFGYYRFDYLNAGDYTVEVTTPLNPFDHNPMRSSTYDGGDPDVNPADSNDDGADLTVAGRVRSQPITVGDGASSNSEPTAESDINVLNPATTADGRTNLTVDFGFYEPVAIGSRVFNDAENSGYRISGQRNGLIDAKVYLYAGEQSCDNPLDTALAVQTTNFAGDYLFTDLRPGTYGVEVVPPPGFISSSGAQGTTSGPYEGANAHDPDDGPGGGINNDDNGITCANGRIFSKPMTLRSREETAQDSSPDPNANRTLDFGLFQPLSLGNLVWDDLNDDGVQNNGEPGIDGVTVHLYHDSNLNNAVDAPELLTPVSTTLTAHGGQYLFRQLGRGVYVVGLPASNFTDAPLAEYRSSDDAAVGHNGPYEPAPDPDDTVDATGAMIDNDDNGQDELRNGQPLILSADVSLGVDIAPRDETPDNDAVTPDSNENLTVDLGVYLPFSVGNRVWLDNNNNGRLDGDENGISNVFVQLYLDDGVTLVSNTTTDAAGYYRFDGLRAGAYLVEVAASNFVTDAETAAGVLIEHDSSDTDELDANRDADSNDNGVGIQPDPEQGMRSSLLQLGPNSAEPTDERDLAVGPNPQGARNTFANMTVDFGFHQPTCLGNFIWLDADADGLQSPDENGLGGVTISLFKDDVLVATTISNVFGEYGFCGLTPGNYVVQFTPPVGYDATLGEQGNNDSVDSDIDPLNQRTPVLTVPPDANNISLDAGFVARPTALEETDEPMQTYKLYAPLVRR